MKIVKLSAENVKKLQAVEITPEGTLVFIGGKNGAGKSSVLDSIAYALGGQSLIPSEPIRKGEERAQIEVDLGDIIVTRRFVKKDDSTISTLIVKSKDGATYPSPQAMLDKLLGKLTFDPLAFAQADPKKQREILAGLINVDTSLLEAKRKSAFERRTELNRQRKAKESQLQAAPFYKEMPLEELSIEEVSQELAQAELKVAAKATLEKEIVRSRAVAAASESTLRVTKNDILRVETEIEKLQQQLKELHIKADQLKEEIKRTDDEVVQLQKELFDFEVPDTAAIRARLSEVEQTNRRVRANQVHHQLSNDLSALNIKIENENIIINESEEAKRRAMEDAQYPIEGLCLTDDGVAFNGIPLEQASTSEQLQVSVAIGLALNPKLKVLLIKNGNALDKDSLALLAKQAEEADAQVWVEWVTDTKEGVTVLITDGSVVQ